MSNLIVELNTAGVRELLLSSEVASMLEAEASARCPEGCIVDTARGKNRVVVRITTDTDEARKDNEQNLTLLRSISQ